MNAALQCLSHTSELRNYFLDGSFHHDISQENPLGTKGDAAYAFSILIRRLWLEKTGFISPNFMKALFQKHASLSMYSRNEQHDSQEFLHALLDVLNEDLKRHRSETPRTREKIGSWMGSWAGNNSIVSDLFLGVLKTTVKCPECQMISNNFEPFLNLSLHFPGANFKNTGSMAYFSESITEEPRIISYELNMLDTSPMDFKGKVFNDPNSGVKNFVLLYQKIASLANESQTQSVRDLMNIHKNQAAVAIFETREKLKPEDGIYTLILSSSKTYFYQHFDFFRLMKMNRKCGSAVVLQILNNFTMNLLQIIGLSNLSSKKITYRLRLFDKNSSISICEICKETDLCSCNFEFQNIGTLENKYRYSNYHIFFELCLNWDFMSPTEQDAFLSLNESSKDFQMKLENTKPLSKGKESLTIYDFLKHFRDPEVLCSQNAWFCNKCKKNQRATTQMEIFSAPKVLIIHLKRFRNNRNIKTKINLKINYPLDGLDLKDYVVESLMPEELVEKKLKGEEKYEKKSVVYDLYGVINHHGGNLSCGHYTALCKNSGDGNWYKFDDKLVYEVGEGTICNNDAYVLFYIRKEI